MDGWTAAFANIGYSLDHRSVRQNLLTVPPSSVAVCLAAPPSLLSWELEPLSPLAGLESGGVCLSFVAFLFRGGQREASSTPLLRHWRRRTQKDPSRGRGGSFKSRFLL